jgi:hypothetical protein
MQFVFFLSNNSYGMMRNISLTNPREYLTKKAMQIGDVEFLKILLGLKGTISDGEYATLKQIHEDETKGKGLQLIIALEENGRLKTMKDLFYLFGLADRNDIQMDITMNHQRRPLENCLLQDRCAPPPPYSSLIGTAGFSAREREREIQMLKTQLSTKEAMLEKTRIQNHNLQKKLYVILNPGEATKNETQEEKQVNQSMTQYKSDEKPRTTPSIINATQGVMKVIKSSRQTDASTSTYNPDLPRLIEIVEIAL